MSSLILPRFTPSSPFWSGKRLMENRRELTKSSANCNRGGPNSITNYTYLLCPPCRLQSAITSLIFTLTFGIGPTTNFINLIRVILQISDCITSSVHLRGFKSTFLFNARTTVTVITPMPIVNIDPSVSPSFPPSNQSL